MPSWKASWYLCENESNSSIMNACCWGFMSGPLMPNCIVSFGVGVSSWLIGSRKSSFVNMPTSLSSVVTGREEMSWSCIVFSASRRVVVVLAVTTGECIMPFAGILSVWIFSPAASPVVCRLCGQ